MNPKKTRRGKIRRYVITGPPGSGKTSLINELKKSGYYCVEETARAFIKRELRRGGDRLPWKNVEAFNKIMLKCRIRNFRDAKVGVTFFDRAIPDFIAYTRLSKLVPEKSLIQATKDYRYERIVFFVPFWKRIYVRDSERKETDAEARTIEHDLQNIYAELGYTLIMVPKVSLDKRITFIEKVLRKLS